MSEVTSGIRAILSLPVFYDFVQNALGAGRYRAEIARQYVAGGRAAKLRVLDVGCGTARILDHLPECTYVGFDYSERYIAAAERRYGGRGTFVLAEATQAPLENWRGDFDCLLMLGLLHHLDDDAALTLFRTAGSTLAPGGRIIAVDPTVSAETHPVGRYLASRDRGRNVRSPEGYEALARRAFDDVKLHLRHDLLRVPYSHAILECSRPTALAGSNGKTRQ
jgi:SAM-dependent methyltransferase